MLTELCACSNQAGIESESSSFASADAEGPSSRDAVTPYSMGATRQLPREDFGRRLRFVIVGLEVAGGGSGC